MNDSDTVRLGDRERRLLEKLRRRQPLTRNTNEEHEKRLILGDRVADRAASLIGSWRFIIFMSFFLAAWIAFNVLGWARHWDPYPFILLNLALSFQAAYAAPVIMMSQNRQEAKDRLRAEQDLETDLKAERLIEDVHLHMLDLRLKRWAELLEIQQRQIDMLTELVTRTGGGVEQATGPGASDAPLEGDRGPSLDL